MGLTPAVQVPRLSWRELLGSDPERGLTPAFQLPPQRRKETVWPGQFSTPPSSTGRASTPAAESTLAAIDARVPLSQIVTTGLLVSSPSAPVSRRSRYGMWSDPGM